jgi:hypothetical protein
MLYLMVRAKLKAKHITFMVDKKMQKAIEARCEQKDIKRSDYLRALIAKDLEAKDE